MIKKLISVLMKVFDPRITFMIFILYLSAFVYGNIAFLMLQLIYCVVVLFVIYIYKRRHDYNNDYTLADHRAVKVRYFAFSTLVLLLFVNLTYAYIYDLQEARYFLVMLAVTAILALIVRQFNYKLSAHVIYNGLILFYFGSSPYFALLLFALLLVIGACRVYTGKHSWPQILLSLLVVLIASLLIYA